MKFLPWTILLGSVLAFYRAILFRSDTFIPWDLQSYHLPQAVFTGDCLRRGIFPLWEPGIFCGRPFYAQIQAQIFYPFRLLTLLLAGPLSHAGILRALEVEQIFHVFLSGVFTLLLARRLGMREPAALLSATGYALGCYFASQAEHIGAVETAAWLPLVWLGLVSLQNRVTLPRFTLMSGGLALMLLSGFTPSAIVFFLSCFVLAALLIVLRVSDWRLFPVTAGALAASVLLSAIQFFPTLELAGLSLGGSRVEWKGTGGGLELPALMSIVWPNYLHPLDMAHFDPKYEVTLVYFYGGGLVLFFALVSMLANMTRLKLAFIALFWMAGLLMLGDRTSVGKLVFLALPKLIQNAIYPHHWLAVFSLCMALLAGFGMDRFQWTARTGYAIVFLSMADLIVMGSSRPMNTSRQDPRSVGLDQAIDEPGSAVAQLRRVTAQSSQPPARLDVYKETPAWLIGGEALTGIPVANGRDPLPLTRFIQARFGPSGANPLRYSPVTDLASPMLGFLNVRYILSQSPVEPAELAASAYHLAWTFPGRFVYEDTNVLPRFFFAKKLTAVTAAEAVRDVQLPHWIPAEEVFVEGMDSPPPRISSGDVSVLEYSPNRVRLHTRSGGPGFLVSSEANYPGWRATVDGVETPIYYSNVAFRGIQVPSGDHRIEFEFRPAILFYSAALSAIALAAFGFGLAGSMLVARSKNWL